jgi:hypothetical protein
MKFIFMFFLAVSMIPNLSLATTIICSSETGAFKTYFRFSFNKPQLEIEASYNGKPLKSFVFLDEVTACGKPISFASECTKSEIKDTLKSGEYDFQFSCTDERRGELHFENGVVMVYCYNSDGSIGNHKGSDGCTIDFE